MGIERTDHWLEKEFYQPLDICKNLIRSSEEEEPGKLYEYLLRFGMYRPNRGAKNIFDRLKKEDIWSKVQSIYEHYQNKWKGPDIPVYIFPMRPLWNAEIQNKSGVSFKDKMFLFLNSLKDEKELEALVIHEYHHVCRLNKLGKPMHAFTLLDSLVMEGLAEYMVTKYCGKNYNAKWISYYSQDELSYYWKKYIEKNLYVKRNESIHDRLLYGIGRFPDLIGYAVGYFLISNPKRIAELSIQDTFTMSAAELVDHLTLFE